MFYKLIKLSLIFSLFFLLGCTLATKFEVYKLTPHNNSSTALKSDDLEVDFFLDPREKRKLLFPLLFQKAVEKEPYRILLTVSGYIDDIEPISAKYSINKQNFVDLEIKKANWGKTIWDDGETYFYINTNYLNTPWKDIEEVEFIFEFYGIKESTKTKYMAKKIFKPEFKSFITNDAMSI